MLNNRIANVADMLKNYHPLILPKFVIKDEWWGGRIIDVEQPVKFVKVGLTFEGIWHNGTIYYDRYEKSDESNGYNHSSNV